MRMTGRDAGDSYNYTDAVAASRRFFLFNRIGILLRRPTFLHLFGHTHVGSSLFGLIPAAGSGERFGAGADLPDSIASGIPKQYQPLRGAGKGGTAVAGNARPMLLHSIDALLSAHDIELVFVVLAPGDERFRALDLGAHEKRVAPLYCGGASRRDSVLNGLVAASSAVEPDDWILVHDAARPCLGAGELRKLIDALRGDVAGCGGLLALPVADTLKRADGNAGGGKDGRVSVEATLSRDRLWQAQTPQMFRHAVLLDALRGDPGATDEASAVERLGLRPRLIEGSSRNIKVTYGPDLALAALILQASHRL